MSYVIGESSMIATLVHMSTGWQRVGELITEEVPRLHRMGWKTFANYAGLGTSTVNDLRRGIRTGYDDLTIARIESALHWKHGSIEAIVNGRRDPVRLPDPYLAEIMHFWPEISVRDRAHLADQARRYARG